MNQTQRKFLIDEIDELGNISFKDSTIKALEAPSKQKLLE